jgi:Protein of unknown function (DUF2778)
MRFGTNHRDNFGLNDHRPLPPNALWQRTFGGIALACFAALCAWIICSNLAGTGDDRIELAGSRGDKLAAVKPSAPASKAHDYLFDAFSALDPRPSLGFPPASFATNAPPPRGNGDKPPASPPSQIATRDASDSPSKPLREPRVAEAVILPAPRPRLRLVAHAPASESTHAGEAVAEKPAEEPSLFERLFGKPVSLTLAYAAPDVGGLGYGQSIAASRYDQWTAVYDISAHTVYMPDGTRLEAHSGLGSMLDDPHHADEKNRGVTPPDVYDLEPRETLFHGVRALRLVPQDDRKTMGRAGLLAHSFMLGPNGDSNGCVSFRNYDAFLQAYLDHKIKRLAVVARLE